MAKYVYRQIWKKIEDYPDYEVSNFGQIKSFKANKPIILKQGLSGPKPYQYLMVSLSKTKKSKSQKIHRLVLLHFEGPCPDGMEGCHDKAGKEDNSIWNLRWDTPKNNHADKYKHGTALLGKKNHSSKLTEKDIPIIRDLHSKGWSCIKIGARFGVGFGTIDAIIRGKTWVHVDQTINQRG